MNGPRHPGQIERQRLGPEQVDAGKGPLIVERGDRFYVYLATDA